ncbi:MAG: sulfatase-like hydrolase/transferase, partial [Thermoanaerobaculia bacterium]
MRRLVLLLALLSLLASCARERQSVPSPAAAAIAPGAPVILISVDTLRADHLPAYGYRGVATPAIDALRRDAILFENAYSQVPLTLPSHSSILSGLLPADDGVRDNLGYRFDASKHPTIPSLLHEEGYATGAAVSAYVLRGETGLAPAFDFYDSNIEVRRDEALGRLQRPGTETIAIAKEWIGARESKPFFFFLHLFEPHTPYDPPEPFRTKYAANPYDGEIAAVDSELADFLGWLRSEGIYDRAIIVFLSDHGEGLGDHGEEEHGIFLYREAIHVPLMLKLPGRKRAGETVAAPVALIDVLPTLAQLTGFSPPADAKGVSLLASANAAPGSQRTIFSETMYPRLHLGWSELRSLVSEHLHFIDAPSPELYDVVSDPHEKSNIASEQRRQLATLKTAIAPFRRSLETPQQIDPEEAKKLAALGYLGSSSTPEGPLPDPKERIGDLAVMDEAWTLAKSGHSDTAIRKFESFLQKNPGVMDAWIELAGLCERSGRLGEAASSYRRAIALSPASSAGPALSLGWVYLQMGELDQAATHASIGVASDPHDAELL